MTYPSTTLLKQIHEAEREIEALESKIQFADLTTTYPHEYAEMRSKQEELRQQILKCRASLDEEVRQSKTVNSRSFDS